MIRSCFRLPVCMILLLLSAAALAGKPIQLPLEIDANRKLSFVLQDARPKKDSTGGLEKISFTKCGYSVMRVPDDIFLPGRLALLADRLAEKLDTQLSGKTVVLEHFTLHRNFSTQGRDELKKMGEIGRMMADVGPVDCSSEYFNGGYSPHEAPNGKAPIVIVIHLRIDDKTIESRTVYEPVKDGINGEEFFRTEVTSALVKSLDSIVEKTEKKLLEN